MQRQQKRWGVTGQSHHMHTPELLLQGCSAWWLSYLYISSLLISMGSYDLFQSESKIIQVTRYCQLHTITPCMCVPFII